MIRKLSDFLPRRNPTSVSQGTIGILISPRRTKLIRLPLMYPPVDWQRSSFGVSLRRRGGNGIAELESS